MLSHGQTVHSRPHSVIHHLKAMHHRIKMSYLEPILVHPVRRQIFGDTAAQTFYISRDFVLSLHTFTKPFSTCASENLGHKLSDEPWADLLGSKLSDWQPFEIFFGADTKNCKKRRFLLKTLLLDIF